MQTEVQRLEDLLQTYQRRLHALEKRAARQGISTPPEVEIEIEDIQVELDRIAAKLTALQPTDRSPPPSPIPPKTPALSSAELRSLRQRASAAYYARRWAEGERLLTQLVEADPNDAEVRERLRLLAQYREVSELRDAGDWEAVLGALSDLTRQQPGFADPDRHGVWAEIQQRRDTAYEAALAACDRADWVTAETVLAPLLAEYPDDQDAAALLDMCAKSWPSCSAGLRLRRRAND